MAAGVVGEGLPVLVDGVGADPGAELGRASRRARRARGRPGAAHPSPASASPRPCRATCRPEKKPDELITSASTASGLLAGPRQPDQAAPVVQDRHAGYRCRVVAEAVERVLVALPRAGRVRLGVTHAGQVRGHRPPARLGQGGHQVAPHEGRLRIAVEQQRDPPVGRAGLPVGESGGGGHGRHSTSVILAPVPDRAALERRTTEILQRLIRFNTVNPPGKRGAGAALVAELLEEAGFDCELLAAVPGRPNLVARSAPSGSDGPTLCLLGHVDTVLADPGGLAGGSVVGRAARRLRLGARRQGHEEPGCGRGGRGAGADRGGLAARGRRAQAGRSPATRRPAPTTARQWLVSEHPDLVRADFVVNEGAGELIRHGEHRVYGVCVAEKGVFRFTLTPRAQRARIGAAHRRQRAAQACAPPERARRCPRPVPVHQPEVGRAVERPRARPGRSRRGAGRARGGNRPKVAVLLEPMVGVTLTPTMISASEKINVVPSHARLEVDCRVPPDLGEPAARAGDPRGARRQRLRPALLRRGGGQPVADRNVADGARSGASSLVRIPMRRSPRS